MISTHNADLRDTVLLGFLKDGKHLVGYTAREYEDEEDFSSGLLCTYTLSLWLFDDNTMSKHAPLQKVCVLKGKYERKEENNTRKREKKERMRMKRTSSKRGESIEEKRKSCEN